MKEDQITNSRSLPIIIVLTALFALLPFHFLRFMPFDPAELENLQASWLVHSGLVPYRDFFEHHSPLFFSISSIQFHFVDVETSVKIAIRQIFINRVIFWSGSLIIVTLASYLSYLWRGKKAAIYCAAILLSTAMFSRVGIEIHPEGFGAFLWSLTIFISYLAFIKFRSSMMHFLTGIFMGLVIITTQEMIILVPWIFLGAILTTLVPIYTQVKQKRFQPTLFLLAGIITVVIATALYFADHHTLNVFIDQMLYGYNYHISPVRNFAYLFIQQPLSFLLPLFFGVDAIRNWLCKKAVDASEMFFLVVGIGTTISLLTIPAAHQQFFLFLIPILSVLSGGTLIRFSDWLARKVSFLKVNPNIPPLSEIVLLICMIPGIILSGYTLVAIPKNPQPQLEIISYVYAHSNPGDEVLDGRTGAWLFRSVPWYYWVQHTQIHEDIPQKAVEALLTHLKNDADAPRIVNFDPTLSRIPDIKEYVFSHFEKVDIGDLWIKPGIIIP